MIKIRNYGNAMRRYFEHNTYKYLIKHKLQYNL